MAAPRHRLPKGTFDILPAEQGARRRLLERAAELLGGAGYGRIETPAFEETELFSRGVGGSTDIVRKEMFNFTDRADRPLTLRPEGTAAVARAYLEHGMHKLAQPVKLWYAGAFFRAESPQAGRFRQFNQIGAEAIGSPSPLLDAELIISLDDLLRGLGVGGLELRLASLGSAATRLAYRDELRAYLRRNEAALGAEVQARIDENPLRAFDSDHPGTREVMVAAPTLLQRLSDRDAERFDAVRAALDSAGVAYRLDGSLVRGLDYYTDTVFEFNCDRLGAQSGIAGGGRYDGLIELLGGAPTPGVGWALGIERVLIALDAAPQRPRIDAFVVATQPPLREVAFALVIELRRAGLAVDLDLADRSAKGQFKQADRSGARVAIILGEDGTETVRELRTGKQRPLERDRVAAQIAALRDSAAG